MTADDRNFVLQRVFLPLDQIGVVEPLTVIETLGVDSLRPIADAFRRNVMAVVSTATVPFQLTAVGVQNLRWQQLAAAELIRARTLIDQGTPEEEARRIALDKAQAQLSMESDLLGDRTLESLGRALTKPEFTDGASELLRQCSVLSWSALEVLAQDTFVELLNTKPSLTMRLCADEATKKLFQLKAVGIETLVEHEFDLSHRMGHILIRLRAIDSIPMMRSTFSALLPNAEKLREAFADTTLWTLNQRRNLIVHKRGVIDQEYLDRTGEDLGLGSQLVIMVPDLEEYLRAVIVVGSELLRSVAGI
jgi:hypothetical protein